MGTWTAVSKLSVVLETGEQSCAIAEDSREHIGVVISIQPTDDDGNTFAVSASELLSSVKLIDYVTESEIPKDQATETSNWYWKDGKVIDTEKGRVPQIRYDVYRTTSAIVSKSISVKVETGSKTYVYSSLNGTYHSSVLIRPHLGG